MIKNSENVEEIKKKGVKNGLLIVKHPFDWDGRKQGKGFLHLSAKDYRLMGGMKVSIYSLHTPLDKNRNDAIVSTAHGFARILELKVEEEFAQEGERNQELSLGLIGRVQDKNFDGLVKRLNSTLHYLVKTMKVNNVLGRVAVVTGGGFVPELVREAREKGCNTYITGIITPNSSEYDKENYPLALQAITKMGMNIIGCSHYLTEKWAMAFSLPYFQQFCKAEFIEDKSALKKLE